MSTEARKDFLLSEPDLERSFGPPNAQGHYELKFAPPSPGRKVIWVKLVAEEAIAGAAGAGDVIAGDDAATS